MALFRQIKKCGEPMKEFFEKLVAGINFSNVLDIVVFSVLMAFILLYLVVCIVLFCSLNKRKKRVGTVIVYILSCLLLLVALCVTASLVIGRFGWFNLGFIGDADNSLVILNGTEKVFAIPFIGGVYNILLASMFMEISFYVLTGLVLLYIILQPFKWRKELDTFVSDYAEEDHDIIPDIYDKAPIEEDDEVVAEEETYEVPEEESVQEDGQPVEPLENIEEESFEEEPTEVEEEIIEEQPEEVVEEEPVSEEEQVEEVKEEIVEEQPEEVVEEAPEEPAAIYEPVREEEPAHVRFEPMIRTRKIVRVEPIEEIKAEEIELKKTAAKQPRRSQVNTVYVGIPVNQQKAEPTPVNVEHTPTAPAPVAPAKPKKKLDKLNGKKVVTKSKAGELFAEYLQSMDDDYQAEFSDKIDKID